jgi:hypothetical protein
MKAVIYHADAKPLWNAPKDLYKKLFSGFVDNAHQHNIKVIHLTLSGHEGWGDENIYYDGLDKNDIVYNREVCFCKFLEQADDDIYWFTEPDARIIKMFDIPKADLTMLYRDDEVHMTPSFRIARKSALPIFNEILQVFDGAKDWHGDSKAFNTIYANMGNPTIGRIEYKGLQVEFLDYKEFGLKNSRYVTHHKFSSKSKLV